MRPGGRVKSRRKLKFRSGPHLGHIWATFGLHLRPFVSLFKMNSNDVKNIFYKSVVPSRIYVELSIKEVSNFSLSQ